MEKLINITEKSKTKKKILNITKQLGNLTINKNNNNKESTKLFTKKFNQNKVLIKISAQQELKIQEYKKSIKDYSQFTPQYLIQMFDENPGNTIQYCLTERLLDKDEAANINISSEINEIGYTKKKILNIKDLRLESKITNIKKKIKMQNLKQKYCR